MTSQSSIDNSDLLEEKEARAFELFKEYAPKTDPDMIPCMVKYATDEKKGTFYFRADHRVDFRELVRQLASKLNISVEMRQIGDREHAAMVGGIGPCGCELCCSKNPGCCHKNSTIKMAKNQGLSLNPTKISGMCGRLMCCLRFENDYYKEFNDAAPKLNSFIETPDGDAKVIELDAIHEIVKLKHEDESPRKISLYDFVKPSEGEKPTKVNKKAWEDAANTFSGSQSSSLNVVITTSQFTGDDKVGDAHNVKLAEKKNVVSEKKPEKKKRRRRKSGDERAKTAKRPGGNSSALNSKESEPLNRKKSPSRTPRKRRTTKITS